MSERLVPRVVIARPDEIRETVPAYVVRDGLAIHVAPPAREAPIWWAITATGCGRRLGLFDKMDGAERALLALAPLADWATAEPEQVQHLREQVMKIITECGDVRYRVDE